MSEELDQQLSAYLDGVLAHEHRLELELRLATEPMLAARFEGLKRANSLVRDYFDSELNEPVPLAMARAIEGAGNECIRVPIISDRAAPEPVAAAQWLPFARVFAASLALVAFGAAGGYLAATWSTASPDTANGWLADIADYHRVYAVEKRHLVEVEASEKAHLETWLTKVVGVQVKAPDLTAQGLTFEGGRLLVAASKPVAQLMYRRADGSVVALCMIESGVGGDGTFAEATIGNSRLVSWKEDGSAYVVVGALTDATLADIAKAAAPLV